MLQRRWTLWEMRKKLPLEDGSARSDAMGKSPWEFLRLVVRVTSP